MVDENEVNTFNNQSSSLIKLNNGTVLYLREVNKFLALVCILREENFQKQGKQTNSLSIRFHRKLSIVVESGSTHTKVMLNSSSKS